MIVTNIKNLIPYLLLIAIYFFFVNLEAKKDKNNIPSTQKENFLPDEKSSTDDSKLKITIPVIPYTP